MLTLKCFQALALGLIADLTVAEVRHNLKIVFESLRLGFIIMKFKFLITTEQTFLLFHHEFITVGIYQKRCFQPEHTVQGKME